MQDATSRYLGLVVLPGEHIVRIEVEEFASQVKTRPQRQVPGEDMKERGKGEEKKKKEQEGVFCAGGICEEG